MIRNILLIMFLLARGCVPSFAQQNIPRDELPNTNSADSTAVLNNNLRLQQNAINSIGGYFNSSGALSEANGGTGANLSNAPNGSVFIQDAGNVGIGTFGQGTSGQTIISQGTGSFPIWASPPFVPNNIQVFTSNGTWTKPVGVSNVYVKVIGKGGPGGNGGHNSWGNGGSCGGYAEGPIAVTGNVSVTIGSTNSFAGAATISVVGTSAGTGASFTYAGPAGASVDGPTNQNGVRGGNGCAGFGAGGGGGTSGAGGGNDGSAGSGYGGGGGGGGACTTACGAGGNGGAGSDGAVIVYY